MAFSTSMQNSISCSLCFEHYDSTSHLPKILPCQHTFCLQCVVQFSCENKSFSCPICRSKIARPKRGMSALMTNLTVRDLAEEHQKMEDAAMKCENHTSNDCIIVCLYCLVGLCIHCINNEVSKGDHKDHQMEDICAVNAALRQRLHQKLKTSIQDLENQTLYIDKQVYKTLSDRENDINKIAKGVKDVLSDWEQNELCVIRDLKTNTAQFREKIKAEINLKKHLLEQQNSPLGSIICELKSELSVPIFDIQSYLPHYCANSSVSLLLNNVTTALSTNSGNCDCDGLCDKTNSKDMHDKITASFPSFQDPVENMNEKQKNLIIWLCWVMFTTFYYFIFILLVLPFHPIYSHYFKADGMFKIYRKTVGIMQYFLCKYGKNRSMQKLS